MTEKKRITKAESGQLRADSFSRRNIPMPDGLLARLARSAGYVLTGNAPADWFGPQLPLAPQAPPEVAGRQFDYPFGFNLAVAPRSQERTGFAELRGLADSYDLLRAVIETRKDQMERLTWRIRPRALAPTGGASDPRLSALTQFFASPDRRHGWAPWLRDAARGSARHRRAGALQAPHPRRRALCARAARRRDHQAADRRLGPHARAAGAGLSADSERRAGGRLRRATS